MIQKSRLKISTLVFLILCIKTTLIAQSSTASDYIVLITEDTIYGTIKNIDLYNTTSKFNKKIKIITANGKRKKIKRDEVLALKFGNYVYESFWLYQSSDKITFVNPRYDINERRGKQHFLKVVSKGKISHYLLEWVDGEFSSVSSMSLLKKENDLFLVRADQGVLGLKRKVLEEYFTNCPDLQQKITEKLITEVAEVVDFYNTYCD